MHGKLSQLYVQSYWLDVCNPKKFVIIRLQDLDPWQSKVQLALRALGPRHCGQAHTCIYVERHKSVSWLRLSDQDEHVREISSSDGLDVH